MSYKSKELIGYIYKFTNKINNKCYIGKTSNLKRRLWEHKHETCKKDTAFGKALRKYGFNNFDFEILVKIRKVSDRKKLDEILNNLEKYYIEKYNSYHFGYNLTKGGDGSLEFHHSEETKIKMSRTRQNISEEYKEILRQRIKNIKNIHRFKKGEFVPKHYIKVEQYDRDGNYIKTYNSVIEAANAFNSSESSNIISVCKGRRKTAFGFFWKYETKQLSK